ncbi:cytochrome C [Flavobacteriaceae bacterium AU392]|nr:cytochrome C [Flavobacteriaceae bacterium]RKM85566.1 cytochrome C [Flavobacteriaceae bacterium AU392]
MNKKNNIYVLAVLLVLLTSCKHKENEYHGIIDKIEAESENYHGTSISSEALLEGTDLIKITEGDHTFLIPERKGQLKSFACIECHNKPLKQMKGLNGKKAHWDIKLNHASNTTMNCITCHNGNDMNNLNTITGNAIDFNASYKLCAQCHSSQFEDWKGGAHGKKVAGWAPPRASFTCVNCHNPHKPGFETRWPKRYNTEKVKEREEQIEH